MTGDDRSGAGSHWTFFTNHAHVLFVLAQEPDLRLRDVAERVDITERAAQRIVRDLEDAGYVRVQKSGRRNTYVIHPQLSLRHPVEAHCSIADLLQIIAGSGRRRRARPAAPSRRPRRA
jgi:DNA-binding IclR family transcriptional regulator